MEKISWWDNCNPVRCVVSVFHPSSWGDRLLDRSRAHALYTNCGRANESNRGCVFLPNLGMVGTSLARTFTLSGRSSKFTASGARSCNFKFDLNHVCFRQPWYLRSWLGLGSCQSRARCSQCCCHLKCILTQLVQSSGAQPSDSLHFHHEHATSRAFQPAALVCDDWR